MVTVKEVEKGRLESLVRVSYNQDYEGFDKYHIEKFDFETSVQKTLSMVEEMGEQVNLKYYEVQFDNKAIGYFIIFKECLYSFAIAKNYRIKSGVLKEWWALVKIMLERIFVCILYRNNTRAISFLQRMGMKETEGNFEDKNLITLVNI